MLNLCVDLGDLGLIPLPLSHEGCEVVARDEGELGLKVAPLVFDDLVDVAHGEVVDVLKAGDQAREYGVEFNFQLLSFRAAAELIEQTASQKGIGKVGKGVFNLDFVIS